MNHHNYGAHGSALIMSIFQPKWFQPQKSLSKSELKIVFELRRPKKTRHPIPLYKDLLISNSGCQHEWIQSQTKVSRCKVLPGLDYKY
jgi:hypothetical protein